MIIKCKVLHQISPVTKPLTQKLKPYEALRLEKCCCWITTHNDQNNSRITSF
uniref:Uncharacterized protein n=1 Tax=Arundo donax TaxID=35708 RepID=A0A0A9BVI5_ARUDO